MKIDINIIIIIRIFILWMQGSQRHHTLSLRKSKTSTPSSELRKSGDGMAWYSLSYCKARRNGESGVEIGLALCDSSVDIYFDSSFECRT